ncbi:MAG: transposase [Chloroflexota bacterium]|nr:transposase [Chloroflexota bacterium]
MELPESCPIVQTRLMIVRLLAQRILELHEQIADVTKRLGQRVRESQTPLLELDGVGEVVAARVIGEFGLEIRIHSAAALATLAGIAPLQVSSGARHGHRVNFGGNRQLNRAIQIIALGQRRCNLRAQEYYAKKRAACKTKRAARRYLKRQLVKVLYRRLQRSNMWGSALAPLASSPCPRGRRLGVERVTARPTAQRRSRSSRADKPVRGNAGDIGNPRTAVLTLP